MSPSPTRNHTLTSVCLGCTGHRQDCSLKASRHSCIPTAGAGSLVANVPRVPLAHWTKDPRVI